jgi:hypothetical protein
MALLSGIQMSLASRDESVEDPLRARDIGCLLQPAASPAIVFPTRHGSSIPLRAVLAIERGA